VDSLWKALHKAYYFALDIETTGLDMLDAEVIGVALATEKGEWYIDFEEHSPYDVWRKLYVLLDNGNHVIISHNASFDMYFVYREMWSQLNMIPSCFRECRYWWDTMSMAVLVDENLIGAKVSVGERKLGALSLKALSWIFLGREQRVWEEDFLEWTPEERAEYAKADVRNTFDLAVLFSGHLYKRGIGAYYIRCVAPMAYVTMMMERLGIQVDVHRVLQVQSEVQKEIESYRQQIVGLLSPRERVVIDAANYPGTKSELQEELQNLVPLTANPEVYYLASGNVSLSKSKLKRLYEELPDHPIWSKLTSIEYDDANPNSSQQLAAYLLEKGYRLPMTQAGNYSVSREVLELLAKSYPDDPLWEPLFKMRRLEKLQNTYVTALLDVVWEDGTVHPEWNQTGTVTGRYSTSVSSQNKKLNHKRGPALQTIPRADTITSAGWEYNPRSWFISRPGKILCVADLKQAEVRMLAVMSQDERLIQVVREGTDIHAMLASRLWPDAWEQGDEEERKRMRTSAKTIVFGTIYGIGPKSLATRLGISEEEAQELLNDFYTTFSGVSTWKQEETWKLMRYGYVTTYLGRWRKPILIQQPPRVTAPPSSEEYLRQSRRELLWQAEYELAMQKAHIVDEDDQRAKEARCVRQALNFEIQGSVAELINDGLIWLVRREYDVLAQIHDEVIVEIPDKEEEKEKLERFLRELYEIEIAGVPFALDVHFGYSWAEGKE